MTKTQLCKGTYAAAGIPTDEPSRAEESTEAEQTVKAAVSHTGKSFVKLMQAFLRELSGSREREMITIQGKVGVAENVPWFDCCRRCLGD